MKSALFATVLALSSAIALASCTHSAPTPNATDAGASTAHADATPPATAATPATTTTTTTTAANANDAGTIASDTGSAAVASDAASGKSTIYDRILAKPKDQSATADTLRATVESAANAKVKTARRTAVHWMLFQFEPTSSGRTADDQQKLIDALKQTGLFDAVEGDRLMKVQ